jgi:hypothetical protein
MDTVKTDILNSFDVNEEINVKKTHIKVGQWMLGMQLME